MLVGAEGTGCGPDGVGCGAGQASQPKGAGAVPRDRTVEQFPPLDPERGRQLLLKVVNLWGAGKEEQWVNGALSPHYCVNEDGSPEDEWCQNSMARDTVFSDF